MPEKCTCGRAHTHCRICGSRNVYRLKFRSMEKSIELGRPITVYGCRGKCGLKTDETMPCTAEPYDESSSDYVPFKPKTDQRPQAVLTPNTDDYIIAFGKRYDEVAASPKYKNPEEVFQALQKEGWVLPPMTDSVNVSKADTKGSEPEPVFEPVPLEEIIRKMGEKK